MLEELYLAGNALVDLPRLDAERAFQQATGIVVDLPQSGNVILISVVCRSEEWGVGLMAVSGFEKLRLLDISGCGLDEWSQVTAFAQLPALKELVVDGNAIQVTNLRIVLFYCYSIIKNSCALLATELIV